MSSTIRFPVFSMVTLALIAALLVGCGGSAAPKERSSVPEAANGHGLETARGFLLQCREAPGYGMYSYLLFAARPDAEARVSAIALVKTYLRQLPTAAAMEQGGFERSELNLTYLPLVQAPPAFVGHVDVADAAALERAAAWVVDEGFDYICARRILARLDGSHHRGPYIVSSQGPLARSAGASQWAVVEDIGWARNGLEEAWVREYLASVEGKRNWVEENAERLALRLRRAVQRTAATLPRVVAGFESAAALWQRITDAIQPVAVASATPVPSSGQPQP